ncbi:MAG: hypothetical protein RIS88_1687 [Pseudomonadota bacterium]
MKADITPGQHLGPLPLDPALRAELDRAHALGFDTCLADFYGQLPTDIPLATLSL